MPNGTQLLGIMVTKGDTWMIKGWLERHAAMFERLAVLDGSPPGSVDARWISVQCQEYPNVRYGNEKEWLKGSVTDRGLRDAATRILLDPGQTMRGNLTGRWIMNAHPDEWYVQDVRELAGAIDSCCPGLNFVRCDQLYAMPAPSERLGIMSHAAESNGFTTFHPIKHLTTADRSYSFRNEVCLFKWTSSAKWGVGSGATPLGVYKSNVRPSCSPKSTTPACQPMHMRPFYVHFKVHDFSRGSIAVEKGRLRFTKAGMGTGIFKHPTHGNWRVNDTRDPMDQIFSYYKVAQRSMVPVIELIASRCNKTYLLNDWRWQTSQQQQLVDVLPPCRTPWVNHASFSNVKIAPPSQHSAPAPL